MVAAVVEQDGEDVAAHLSVFVIHKDRRFVVRKNAAQLLPGVFGGQTEQVGANVVVDAVDLFEQAQHLRNVSVLGSANHAVASFLLHTVRAPASHNATKIKNSGVAMGSAMLTTACAI